MPAAASAPTSAVPLAAQIDGRGAVVQVDGPRLGPSDALQWSIGGSFLIGPALMNTICCAESARSSTYPVPPNSLAVEVLPARAEAVASDWPLRRRQMCSVRAMVRREKLAQRRFAVDAMTLTPGKVSTRDRADNSCRCSQP